MHCLTTDFMLLAIVPVSWSESPIFSLVGDTLRQELVLSWFVLVEMSEATLTKLLRGIYKYWGSVPLFSD